LRLFTLTISTRQLSAIAMGLLLSVSLAAQTKHTQDKNKKDSGPRTVEARRTIAVETREQLFDTLCALDAAGFDSSGGATQTPGRAQLRQQMLALRGPAVEALRKYYREHALADSGATFSRFVSFALAAGPPPKFEFELRREDLPPDALALEGFNEILANFYREAQLDLLWKHYQPEYDHGVEAYSAPVSEMTLRVTSYLREILKSNNPRTLSIYVELLAGGNTNFRNYGDHYELVVSPNADLPVDDIRHAMLHFLLDPIAIKYRIQAERAMPLLEYAARAPRLPVEYHDDYSAFFDECLVRAVELRLKRLSPADLSAAIDQAESIGFVLVRPIYAGLNGFEKSEPAMGYYLPDLIKSIDVAGEARRLRGVKFAEAATADDASEAAGNNAAGAAKPAAAADPVDDFLAEGQRQISARNGAAAATAFERVLAEHPNDMRATYGLAVASALQGQPERARELFAKVIAASQNTPGEGSAQTDPSNVSWSHIYLGRMYDVEGQRDLAVIEYRAALSVAGVPESARAAAQRGVDTGYQTPSRDAKPDGKS